MMDEPELENVECNQRDFNLSDNGECLIGFKGEYEQYITNLSFYKVTKVGFKVSTKPAGPTGGLNSSMPCTSRPGCRFVFNRNDSYVMSCRFNGRFYR